jgi:arylsulfatase A-like enzyme
MHMGEKQNWEKFTLWERSTRVPLLIAVPDTGRPATRVTSPASLVDIYPTLCELVGLPVPAQCMGTSLVPQLENPKAARAVPAITTQTKGPQSGHSVRDENWRYIRYFDSFEELYNHANDPNEYTNLANNPEFAAVKRHMLEQLKASGAPLDGVYRDVKTGGAVVGKKRKQQQSQE